MLKVIGSGFGRTGTLSLKVALEQLGFGPCYHMVEVFSRPKHVQAWHDAGLQQPVDWQTLMQNYQSSVDFPASIFYRELMAAFPDAKVIHTVRDPERWYQSTYETVYRFNQIAPRWVQRLIGPLRRLMDMIDLTVWQGVFEGDFENRQRAIEIFKQHTETVLRTVPPERLLVFDMKDGWEPLCRFLQVPVPNTPFPHVNDTNEMKRRLKIAHRLFHWGPVALSGALLVALGALMNGLQ